MAAPSPAADKPIILVGPTGAGKTTVGRRLAERLGLPFIDIDAEVERDAGISLSEMFATFGEAGFRDGERRLLARLAEGPAQVIATGGGAFVDEGTRRLLLERCLAVWLDAEPDTLAARVGSGQGRPLLEGGDVRARLAELADRRNPFYAQAPIRVCSAARSPDRVVDAIVAALAERPR